MTVPSSARCACSLVQPTSPTTTWRDLSLATSWSLRWSLHISLEESTCQCQAI